MTPEPSRTAKRRSQLYDRAGPFRSAGVMSLHWACECVQTHRQPYLLSVENRLPDAVGGGLVEGDVGRSVRCHRTGVMRASYESTRRQAANREW